MKKIIYTINIINAFSSNLHRKKDFASNNSHYFEFQQLNIQEYNIEYRKIYNQFTFT